MNYKPADKPTMYFIGVTTGQSSIMNVFPQWAEYLGLGDVELEGIDFELHDEPERYREAVDFIKSDPLSYGALVTTHKIDLLQACRDMFDHLDKRARIIGEISGISKVDGKLLGHAKDPITAGLSLKAIAGDEYWGKTGADLCILGAGGSSLALSTHIILRDDPAKQPKRIFVTNRSPKRIEEMKKVHGKLKHSLDIEYILAPDPEDNDRVVGALNPYSVVANATGLGKDVPGSPTTDDVLFPENGVAWDFNYRGDLLFLDQAERQKEERSLRIEDGWRYFIYGWTRVIAEVFHVDIPVKGSEFEEICKIAENYR